jgi:hypothetical protein
MELTLSILAADKFQILLTKQEIWQKKPGIIINLESIGNNWIALCSHTLMAIEDSGCYLV